MNSFYHGSSYHGSSEVMEGGLQGSTDRTDYFYFFCPGCEDQRVLRILDWGIHADNVDLPYDFRGTREPKRFFSLVFHLYCEHCELEDFVKVGNTGWQGGNFADCMKVL